jgi:hypothetical protein
MERKQEVVMQAVHSGQCGLCNHFGGVQFMMVRFNSSLFRETSNANNTAADSDHRKRSGGKSR